MWIIDRILAKLRQHDRDIVLVDSAVVVLANRIEAIENALVMAANNQRLVVQSLVAHLSEEERDLLLEECQKQRHRLH